MPSGQVSRSILLIFRPLNWNYTSEYRISIQVMALYCIPDKQNPNVSGFWTCGNQVVTVFWYFQLSLYATTSVTCLSGRRVTGNQISSLNGQSDAADSKRKTSLRHVTTAQSPNETKKSKGRLRKIDLSEDSTLKVSKKSFPLRIASR